MTRSGKPAAIEPQGERTPDIPGVSRIPAGPMARRIVELRRILEDKRDPPRFIQSPLATEFFNQYQIEDEDYKRAMNYDVTETLFRYLFWKIKNDEPINFSTAGIQRGGKSGLTMSLALDISETTGIRFPTDASFIYRNQAAFLNDLPRLVPHGTYIIDEQKTMRAQAGSFAQEQELEDFSHITAKDCINSFWNCPDFQDRDSEYGLRIIALDRKKALTKALLFDLKNSDDGFIRMFGSVVVKHYDPSVSWLKPDILVKKKDSELTAAQLLRKNYELKKDAWNLDIRMRRSADRPVYRLEAAVKLTTDEIFRSCKNKIQRKIVARTIVPPGFVEDEVDEIVDLAANPHILFPLLKRSLGEKDYKAMMRKAGLEGSADIATETHVTKSSPILKHPVSNKAMMKVTKKK